MSLRRTTFDVSGKQWVMLAAMRERVVGCVAHFHHESMPFFNIHSSLVQIT